MYCQYSVSCVPRLCLLFFLFFFNDTATTEIYTLSLHDALPICDRQAQQPPVPAPPPPFVAQQERARDEGDGKPAQDRKSTRLNSSHTVISYAVFCLKKKKNNCKKTIRNNEVQPARTHASHIHAA